MSCVGARTHGQLRHDLAELESTYHAYRTEMTNQLTEANNQHQATDKLLGQLRIERSQLLSQLEFEKERQATLKDTIAQLQQETAALRTHNGQLTTSLIQSNAAISNADTRATRSEYGPHFSLPPSLSLSYTYLAEVKRVKAELENAKAQIEVIKASEMRHLQDIADLQHEARYTPLSLPLSPSPHTQTSELSGRSLATIVRFSRRR